MTEHDELKRYAEGGGGPELSAGIALARGEGPSAEQRARLRAKLGLPAQAPASTPESSVAAGARKGLLGKVGVSAVILALAGAAYWTWLAREPAPQAPSEALPAQRAEPAPAPLAVVTAPPVRPEPAAPVEAAAPARSPRRDAKKASAPENDAPAIDVTAELTLLRRARSHVRSAPERALALVAEHEQRFAAGALVEEREVIAIEALLLSGDDAAGEARAAAFIARYPQSAHVRRVRVLLSEHGTSDQGTRGSATPNR